MSHIVFVYKQYKDRFIRTYIRFSSLWDGTQTYEHMLERLHVRLIAFSLMNQSERHQRENQSDLFSVETSE